MYSIGFSLLLLVLCLSPSQAAVKCGQEFIKSPQKHVQAIHQFASLEEESNREDEWEPIRIHIEYYSENDVSSSVRSYLKDIVEKAVEWYRKVLNIKRMNVPLVFDSSFELYELSDDTKINYTPPDKFFNEGIEADFIFFVGLVSDESLYWAGIATALLVDTQTNQPVVGQFEINYTEEFTYEDDLSIAIHEMAHALGFASWMFPYYIKENGEFYEYEEFIKEDTLNGVALYKVITPTVLKKARAAFGCNSLDGVELETQGGETTVFSHWEKRVMFNDFMRPDIDIDDIVYSDITMALFEDSGWYTVNYEYTQSISWGYKMGCDLFEKPCIVEEKPINDLFCADMGEVERCDYLRLNKGYCNLETFDELPEEFQYFSDENLGGTDMALDFCPIVKPNLNGNCRGIGHSETYLNSDYGEEACENCRCVEGTYSKNNAEHYHVGCHWIECEEDYTIVHIGDEAVECPSDGGEVEVPNYNGVLYCPKWEEVCDPVPCMNSCSGIGICNRGVCECPDGSKGGDCADINKDFSYRDPIDHNPNSTDYDSAVRADLIASLILLALY